MNRARVPNKFQFETLSLERRFDQVESKRIRDDFLEPVFFTLLTKPIDDIFNLDDWTVEDREETSRLPFIDRDFDFDIA